MIWILKYIGEKMESDLKQFKLICITDIKGFTVGNEYECQFLYNVNLPNYERKTGLRLQEDWVQIKNDDGIEVEMILNEHVIHFLPSSNIWVEYIGDYVDSLTKGKWYNLLERGNISLNDRHYYLLNDNNKFVGIYSGKNFKDVSKKKHRKDRLIELGI